MNDYKFELVLKEALSPTAKPSEDLNQSIINRLKEYDYMKLKARKRIATILIAAAVILAMSMSALAAWKLLNPKQVAEHFGDKTLASAFEGKNAVEINKTVVSGGYNITLLGITSGNDLSDFKSSAQYFNPDRTYAVISIAKQDGSKMPDTQDEDYDKIPFFISPLIKGQKPWQVNIASMNGGYSACVIDGVLYRLIECDGIEMFADRGLYLCVSTSTFYDNKAFNYNEKTGEVTVNPKYKGANALFNLPLDPQKADHEKADRYLKELLGEPVDGKKQQAIAATSDKAQKASSKLDPNSDKADIENYWTEYSKFIENKWKKELANAVVVPNSIKEVTTDKNGMAYYQYESQKIGVNIKLLFNEGEKGTKYIDVSEINGKRAFIIFTKDNNGVITGRVLREK